MTKRQRFVRINLETSSNDLNLLHIVCISFHAASVFTSRWIMSLPSLKLLLLLFLLLLVLLLLLKGKVVGKRSPPPRSGRTFSCLLTRFPKQTVVGGAKGVSRSPPLSRTAALLSSAPRRGRRLIAPVNHCAGRLDPPFILPDSNLLLALLHTCHTVFFLHIRGPVEAGR